MCVCVCVCVLGECAILRIATITSLSGRPYVRMEQLGSPWTDFHEIRYFSIFRKCIRENTSFLKIGQEWLALYVKVNIDFWSYLLQFFLEWNIFHTKVVEKIKTHILCSGTICRKYYRLWDNAVNYCREGQATDDDMPLAHDLLDI